MRRHRGEILSPLLVRELGRCRVSSLGAVLYVNRRGFARHVACEECGETLVCGTCGVAMVLGADRALTCPFCATRIQAPDQCPVCASRTFTYRAPGIEMVAGEVAKLLTGVEVITVQSEDGPASAVKAGAVTVGTRTLLGQPWPAQLGVVAVVNADDDLCRPDFRSREQTFRTVSQLAQRATEAGAGLIVQTRRPNDISVCTAAEGQTEGFLDAEVESRRQLGFPPFSRVALIELHGGSDAAASAHAARLSRLLGRLRGVEVLGPVRAPGRGSRFRMLVRIRPDMRLDALVGRGALETAGLRVQVDVDPLDLGWSA
jgi:primosomal protein N' (replication factor Y)